MQQILTSGSPLIVSRGLCVFKSYSALILNGDSQQQLVQACHSLFVNCLKVLMTILINKNEGGSKEALILIASDCFEKIMISHFKDQVLSPYISEMLEILLFQVEKTRNKQLIELVFNLVKKQPEKVKETDKNGCCW